MKSETRLNKMAALLGIEKEIKELLPEKDDPNVIIRHGNAIQSRAAESFLAFLRSSELFTIRKCVTCNKPFAHSYGRVSTCSDRCLRKAIEAMGFVWDATKPPEERWRPAKYFQWRAQRRAGENPEDYQERLTQVESHYPVPLIVEAEALEAIHNLLQEVFQNQSLPESNGQSSTAT